MIKVETKSKVIGRPQYYKNIVKSKPQLVAFGDIDMFNSGNVKLLWTPTEVCNFNCSYCGYKRIKNPHHSTNGDIKRSIKFMERIQDVKIIKKLFIIAAEPTLVKNLDLIIGTIKPLLINCDIITLYSNMSASIDLYRKIMDLFIDGSMMFSLFPSFHKKDIDVDVFMGKLWTLKEEYSNYSNISLDSISFMVEDETYHERAKEVYEKYPGLRFHLFPIREKGDIIKIEQQFYQEPYKTKNNIVKIYKDGSEYFYTKFLNNELPLVPEFKNFICQSWDNLLYLDAKGYLRYCTLTNPQWDMNIKDLEETIQKLRNKKRQVCNVSQCFCDWDVPKYKISEYNKIKSWTKKDILQLKML
jgi:hypothetical protein